MMEDSPMHTTLAPMLYVSTLNVLISPTLNVSIGQCDSRLQYIQIHIINDSASEKLLAIQPIIEVSCYTQVKQTLL